MNTFFPDTSLIVWSVLLATSVSVAQGYYRNSRGSAAAFIEFVGLISNLLGFFFVLLAAAAVYDFGWQLIFTYIGVGVLAGVFAGIAISLLGIVGSMLAIVAMPICVFVVATRVTWFGFF